MSATRISLPTKKRREAASVARAEMADMEGPPRGAGAPDDDPDYLNSNEFIKDEKMDNFVKKHVHPDLQDLFDRSVLEMLVTQGEEFDPPFLFNGENTKPHFLPGLLFPERFTDPKGKMHVLLRQPIQEDNFDHPSREDDEDHEDDEDDNEEIYQIEIKAGRNLIYRKLCNEFVKEFNEMAGMDIAYSPSPNKKLHLTQTKFEPTRYVVFYCRRCADPEAGFCVPVARGRFALGTPQEEDVSTCLLLIESVFFHNQSCKAPASNQACQGLDGYGYDLVPPPPENGHKLSKLNELLSRAYGPWIESINQLQPDAADLPGEPINFGLPEHLCRDNRRQVPLDKPETFPPGVNLQYHTHYASWILYNLIARYNLTEQWTMYRPRTSENKIDNDRWETTKVMSPPNGPTVHMYMNGINLLFGGHQLQRDGRTLQAPGEEPDLHQMGHRDIFSPIFEPDPKSKPDSLLAKHSPLLRGLHAPMTVNVGLETFRSIWVNTISNVVSVKKHAILVNSADTVHGGMNWNLKDPSKADWRPSLHLVFGSVRYPKVPGSIAFAVNEGTYCPAEHLGYLTTSRYVEDALQEEFLKTHNRTVELFKLLSQRDEQLLNPEIKLLMKGYSTFGEPAVSDEAKAAANEDEPGAAANEDEPNVVQDEVKAAEKGDEPVVQDEAKAAEKRDEPVVQDAAKAAEKGDETVVQDEANAAKTFDGVEDGVEDGTKAAATSKTREVAGVSGGGGTARTKSKTKAAATSKTREVAGVSGGGGTARTKSSRKRKKKKCRQGSGGQGKRC